MKMEDLSKRIDELISMAGNVIITTTNDSLRTVNAELYSSFRTAALSFLKNTFGVTHPYYEEFNSEVSSLCSAAYVEIGRGILTAAKDEIDKGWFTSVKGIVSAEILSENGKIDLLKHEVEHRTSQQPHSGTQINITGNIGMVNTGQMRINGSLEIKLEEFRKTGQVELFNAFFALMQAIKKSDNAERDEQIGNVDFLVSQCKTPKEERNYGLIKRLESLLSNASNLTTIWGQVGPEIMKALGV